MGPHYRPHAARLETRADGTLLYTSACEMSAPVRTTGDWLHRWAEERPQKTFLAERYGAGWHEVSYAEVLEQVRAIGAALVARGLDESTPVLVISGNGIDHGLLALAGQYVGVPVVPVAEQYALIHGAHARLRHAIDLVRPKMAYAVDADQYGEALALDAFDGIELVATRPGHNPRVTPFADLLKGDAGVDVDAAHAAVGPDSVVKILLTSGSTSAPKGVPTTHRMMCTNQAQLLDALPFLADNPPVLVDWLPWNHVFGGSKNFNLVLASGGTLYIDDGKPVPALMARTLENNALVSPTISFNVPLGHARMVEALKTDADLRKTFFARLDMIFYAGASLPQEVWEGYKALALAETGRVPLMNTSWGLTETAPSTLIQHEPTDRAGIVGVPVTGATVKLIPGEDDPARFEVRVKGPNLFSGYLGDPEKTAEAFDAEGFFITGDAMRFVEPGAPDLGLAFDGRISEDFKLMTGTWVRAAQLRLELLAQLGPLVSDIVVTGADRREIGLMVFLDEPELDAEGFAREAQGGAYTNRMLKGEIARRLAERAREVQGSSTHVARAILLTEGPDIGAGEVTAKGNLNARRILARRKALLDRLYDDADPATITY